MEAQIDETMNITRQKLLENFDEEVHEKLKVNLRESKEYLSRYESWLWELTRYYLAPYADFSSEDHSFMLHRNPFSAEVIHPGPYRLGKNVEDANVYRVGHSLARRIIESCAALSLPMLPMAQACCCAGNRQVIRRSSVLPTSRMARCE